MVNVAILIPTALCDFPGGKKELRVSATTVRTAIMGLGFEHAELIDRLLTPDGQVRTFINIYLGENNIRVLDGLDTQLSEGDILTIVKAIAGG